MKLGRDQQMARQRRREFTKWVKALKKANIRYRNGQFYYPPGRGGRGGRNGQQGHAGGDGIIVITTV